MTTKLTLDNILHFKGVAQALIAESPLSTVIYDMDGGIVFTNSAFDDLWGGEAAHLPPDYSVRRDPAWAVHGTQALLERVFQGETVVTPPERCDAALSKDGARSVWITGHFYPLIGTDGVQRGVALIHVNLAARIDAEEALRHSENTLRMALDAGRMGAWEWEVAAKRVRWSETLERIHGLQPGTFDGTFEAYQHDIHVDDRERVLRSIARTLEGNEHHISYRIVRPDGVERVVEAHGRLIRGKTGEPQRVVGVCTDVTDQHRADAAARFLIEASELLASSLDYDVTLANVAKLVVPTLADYCIVDLLDSDPSVRVRRVATAHADPAKDTILSRVREFPPRLDSDGIVARTLRSGTAEIVTRIDHVALMASAAGYDSHQSLLDQLRPTSAICAPLVIRGITLGTILLAFADSGRNYVPEDVPLVCELARRSAFAVDGAHLFRATERARAEAERAAAEASSANRAKSDFLAIMSHELRTPLNAIGGYAELLELGIHGPVTGEQLEDLDRIKRSQRHLLSLINDLLNYAKLEAGHVSYRIEVVSVHDALATLELLVAPQFLNKGVTHAFHTITPTLAVNADAEKLRQILVNLMSNAVKFTPSGGSVTVSTQERGEDVAIAVTDTGIGIPAPKLNAIFEPFVQLSRDLTHNQEGTGLGLAISRDLARAMGGELTAASEVGRGSTFTLVLPRA
ncbi:MAG: ATP-binding protein [Gemmatimonadaceae bacterium]